MRRKRSGGGVGISREYWELSLISRCLLHLRAPGLFVYGDVRGEVRSEVD